ncbi:hypothetical protein CEUSTIGMA_g896.t1 [Chlamydomonas eustigma]|uniref:Post-GPI attachment to proteins factor 3 n=1 Tax=Chlamydomonas eustigma TaxID=1157962 RepID=A0A250WRG3_9CHLO|nr:hypothetical protein CEUSTIGMA_g896.t1 [Chlamydomonas eustigma]|eukprot:GAX73444.1 hypothetical protein CEUSTIGMA_g896.t1 [Chlamydomonas eustigma]
MRGIFLISLLLTAIYRRVQGSEGDTSPAFHSCTWRCQHTGCAQVRENIEICGTACPHINQLPIPTALRLTRWSCEDDCRYHCMHELEDARRAQGVPNQHRVIKYFGKWPFQRVLGAQEFMSVLLSLGNMLAHIHACLALISCCSSITQKPYTGHFKMGRSKSPCTEEVFSSMNAATPSADAIVSGSNTKSVRLGGVGLHYPYLGLWLMYSGIHVNAWLWSAAFHVRDTRLTERLDYCSANVVVAASLVCALLRAALPAPKQYRALGIMAVGLVLAVTGWHLRYMLYIKFDYGWNMRYLRGQVNQSIHE